MKISTIITCLLYALLSVISVNLFCETSDNPTVLAQHTQINNHFYIKEDSSDITHGKSLPTSSDDITGEDFTPLQDSNFYRDSRLNISFMYWLRKGLEGSESIWTNMLQHSKNSPSNALSSSFTLMPANIFEPLLTEVVQHHLTRSNALSIPGVHKFNEGGIQFNLHDIGVLLGMLEDVSPKITYSLTRLADVEIVVYSVGAVQIATIFAGTQKAGKYTIYWNGKDDVGKQVPAGDYIAEVKVGQERFVRKRIVIE